MPDFTVVILPDAFATGVATTIDILAAAAALAPAARVAPPTWRVVSPQGGDIALGGGVHMRTQAMPRRLAGDHSTWVVPGLGLAKPRLIGPRLARPDAQAAIRGFASHAARGGSVAASCSGVFLLQAAGLLAGRTVTTSWWLAAELQRLEPACTVDADRMVCADGPLSTAGAAFAQTDLMLHLLRTRFGLGLADAVSRVLLIDNRQAQAGFVLPTMLSNGNALIARLVKRIEAALPTPPSVRALAEECAMSPRTLSRHVRRATGRSTLALLQSVRLNRARMLLETSRMSIERVAEQVGYEDATALRRLMRKVAGANPSRYRGAGIGPRGHA